MGLDSTSKVIFSSFHHNQLSVGCIFSSCVAWIKWTRKEHLDFQGTDCDMNWTIYETYKSQ